MSPQTGSQRETLGSYENVVREALDSLSASGFVRKLWAGDASLWSTDAAVQKTISNRLGWLRSPAEMLPKADELTQFANSVREFGAKHIVLLGMGGSSLCPEVCSKSFGSRPGYPELIVLDTTSPDAVRAVRERIDIKWSVFISASKSGSTIETDTLTEYFITELTNAGVAEPGRHFVAITDPGSPLVASAGERGFLRVFENAPDIGGRYSALSYFGLVPMALIGMDVNRILQSAARLAEESRAATTAAEDPAVRLGATLGALARAGRDKVTFVLSRPIQTFGLWLEQLIAESTGKLGTGIIPVVEDQLRALEVEIATNNISPKTRYGNDRVFVSIGVGMIPDEDQLAALEKSGAPTVRIELGDGYDLGAEFLRWEIATAAAGAVLGVNPFDEPNVTESKKNTSTLLQEHQLTGRLTAPEPLIEAPEMDLAISSAMPREIDAEATTPNDLIRRLMSTPGDGEYLAVLAYLPPSPGIAKQLDDLRERLSKASSRAVTTGFGPRYLHSTGQLHKGGANNGIFLMLMADPVEDLAIPNRPYSFGTLFQAQALGDFRSLDGHGRRAVLVRIKGDPEAMLGQVVNAFFV